MYSCIEERRLSSPNSSCIYGYVNKYINIECFCLLHVGVTRVPMCTNEEQYMQSVFKCNLYKKSELKRQTYIQLQILRA